MMIDMKNLDIIVQENKYQTDEFNFTLLAKGVYKGVSYAIGLTPMKDIDDDFKIVEYGIPVIYLGLCVKMFQGGFQPPRDISYSGDNFITGKGGMVGWDYAHLGDYSPVLGCDCPMMSTQMLIDDAKLAIDSMDY